MTKKSKLPKVNPVLTSSDGTLTEIINNNSSEVTENQLLRYTMLIHPELAKAIKVMAAAKNLTIQDYLNNFLKNFLPFEAKNSGEIGLERTIEEIIKEVPYK